MNLILVSTQEEEEFSVEHYVIAGHGETLGFASVIVDSQYPYLERIDIEGKFQGQGHGTTVIRLLAEKFGRIVAAPDNERCQRLFERLGDEVSSEYWMVDQGFGVYQV